MIARLLRCFLPLLLLLAVCAGLSSCGTGIGTPPTGGPPDTVAPAIVSAEPVNGSVNVHDRTIAVEFSEYVDEGNVPQNVVITPLPAEPPDYDWSGSRLEITFQKPLLEDRTYTVTFGAGITDLANNRLGRPITLRFATGEQIDSARITGIVDGLGKRKGFVMAYQIPPDSASFRPDTIRPDFLAPIGDDGRFAVEGMPPGHFRLFAMTDEEGTQIFTPGVDAYGVPPADVTIDSAGMEVSGVQIRIRPAPDDMTPPALYSVVSINRSRTELRFSEPVDTAGVTPASVSIITPDGTVPATALWRSPANSLALLVAHGELAAGSADSVHVTGLRDTSGNVIPDSTAGSGFTASTSRDTLPPMLLPPGVDSVSAYTFPDSLRIGFDEAVQLADPKGAVVLRDTARGRAEYRLQRVSPALWVAYPLDTLYGVTRGFVEVAMGRFTDLSGNRHDSTARVRVAIAPIKQTGTMEGTIVDSVAPRSPHVITARMTGTNKIYMLKRVPAGRWQLTDIPEGEYEITAFRDSNGDGLYDYGSVLPYRHGEAFTQWHGTVRIRPRWVTNNVNLVIGR